MAKCIHCSSKAIISSPFLCREHFIKSFEKKVFDTIKKYDLFSDSSDVCVACSGGKDSTAVLYLAKKFLKKGHVVALLIDEGIDGYRSHTIQDLERFCSAHSIELRKVSFKKEFGKTLDVLVNSMKEKGPCTICGTLRRYLLNKHSRGFDCVVTGHNLDDESQAILMNIFKNQLDVLARLGPKTGVASAEGFVPRVKPLYFCSEKEVALYAHLMGFGVGFHECPYAGKSYRADLRNMLNKLSGSKGKLNIVKEFLGSKQRLAKFSGVKPMVCAVCGEPSSRGTCNVCTLLKRV